MGNLNGDRVRLIEVTVEQSGQMYSKYGKQISENW